MMRSWLWLYILILLLGFSFRLAIVDFGLPYVDNVDEPNFYLLANDWRGKLDATWRNTWLEGYPPGYICLYSQILELSDTLFDLNVHIDMGIYVGIMRFLSLLMDMVTLAFLILIARWLGGNFAGAIAGAIYAFSAEIIRHSILALPDSATVMFTIISAAITIHALRTKRGFYGLLATAFALLAIVFKYPVFPILLLPATFFILYLLQERIRAIPISFIALAMVAATAFFLLQIYGASNLSNNESVRVRTQFLSSLLSWQQWDLTLNALFRLIKLSGFVIAGIGLLGIVFYQNRKKLSLILLTLIVGFAILAVVPIYYTKQNYPIRYTWPSVSLIIAAFSALAAYPLSKQRNRIVMILSLSFVMLWGLPATFNMIKQYNQAYTYGLAQVWFEENIPDGSVIWVETHGAYRSISRYEAGYSGYKNYGEIYAQDNDFTENLEYIDYIYLEDASRKNVPEINQYPLIKTITNDGRNGPELYIYSTDILATQQKTTFTGQDVVLLLDSYELQQDNRKIRIKSYWQAPEHVPPQDYSYTLYITNNEGVIVFQKDAGLGHRRTSTWDDPQELIRGNISEVILEDDIPTGAYHLWLGIYYWETGERLLLVDSSASLQLGIIQLD